MLRLFYLYLGPWLVMKIAYLCNANSQYYTKEYKAFPDSISLCLQYIHNYRLENTYSFTTRRSDLCYSYLCMSLHGFCTFTSSTEQWWTFNAYVLYVNAVYMMCSCWTSNKILSNLNPILHDIGVVEIQLRVWCDDIMYMSMQNVEIIYSLWWS